MGQILLGAGLMLLGILIGVAIKNRNTPEDGFALLLKTVEDMNPRLQRRGCPHCEYVAKGEQLGLVARELEHHVKTKHHELLKGSPDGHPNVHS